MNKGDRVLVSAIVKPINGLPVHLKDNPQVLDVPELSHSSIHKDDTSVRCLRRIPLDKPLVGFFMGYSIRVAGAHGYYHQATMEGIEEASYLYNTVTYEVAIVEPETYKHTAIVKNKDGYWTERQADTTTVRYLQPVVCLVADCRREG